MCVGVYLKYMRPPEPVYMCLAQVGPLEPCLRVEYPVVRLGEKPTGRGEVPSTSYKERVT